MSEINIELKNNEDLRHQNILLSNKLQEAQKKVAQANQVIAKTNCKPIRIDEVSNWSNGSTWICR